jgi:hypothetical protein
MTMTAHQLAVVVSPGELAVGAAAFHRTDPIRRELLALVDALVATVASSAPPVADLLALVAREGGFSIATPDL